MFTWHRRYAFASHRPTVVALTGTLVLLICALAAVGVLPFPPLHAGHPGPTLNAFAAAAALFAAGQFGRLRIIGPAGPIAFAWGEAATVVLLHLLPMSWTPLAVAVGALPVHVWRFRAALRTRWPMTLHNTLTMALAVAAAGLVAGLVTDPYRAPLGPAQGAALVLGGLAYMVVTIGATALYSGRISGAPVLRTFRDLARSKSVMVVGNIGVGLLLVGLIRGTWAWLLLGPPLLWLTRQAYAFRLRRDDEQRTWREFAEVTGAVKRAGPRTVAARALHGVLRLLPVDSAEIVLTAPDGHRQRYRQERYGPVVECPAGTDEAVGAVMVSRPIVVGGATAGVLRVRPGAGTLSGRDRAILSSYCDALGAALHDAANRYELQQLTERSSYQAEHDPVTGLLNRQALQRRGNEALSTVADPDAPVLFLLLDVDRFRSVNDTLGHAAGDELLRVVAARLRRLARPGELLARLGGDEFALFVPVPGSASDVFVVPGSGPDLFAPAGVDQVATRAREIIEELGRQMVVAGVKLTVEGSVGVVTAVAAEVDLDELLRRADIALYQAKTEANRIARYDSAADDASVDRLALLAELREALSTDDQLLLVLQPAMHLRRGGAVGVEALIRWQHPRRGLLQPGEFMPATEQSELIGPFTRYVLDRALRIAADWTEQGLHTPISVNLSAQTLLDRRLPDDVAALLDRYEVAPGRLVLEITETVAVSESPVVDEVLARLRGLGVQLAVDDFGTGYSSLTFLTRVEVDEVKIDRTFVAKMAENAQAAAIVRTTVDLARQLSLRVVAEGVETAEQRATLTALGVTAAQGYHLYPPMSVEKATVTLRSLSRDPDDPVDLRAGSAS